MGVRIWRAEPVAQYDQLNTSTAKHFMLGMALADVARVGMKGVRVDHDNVHLADGTIEYAVKVRDASGVAVARFYIEYTEEGGE